MIVTFHSLAAVASTAVIGSRLKVYSNATDAHLKSNSIGKYFYKSDFKILLISFLLNVAMHGIMDLTPHNYPLPGKLDVIIATMIYCLIIFLINKRYFLLFTVSFIGSIFPDLIDLTPIILFKYTGFDLTYTKHGIFPWHWPAYSGSLISYKMNYMSNINHALTIMLFLFILFFRRKQIKDKFLRKK